MYKITFDKSTGYSSSNSGIFKAMDEPDLQTILKVALTQLSRDTISTITIELE